MHVCVYSVHVCVLCVCSVVWCGVYLWVGAHQCRYLQRPERELDFLGLAGIAVFVYH